MVLLHFTGLFALLMLASLVQQVAGHFFAPSRNSEPQRPQRGKAYEKDDKGISPTAHSLVAVVTTALGRATPRRAMGHGTQMRIENVCATEHVCHISGLFRGLELQ
jgi:hypothetical protein